MRCGVKGAGLGLNVQSPITSNVENHEPRASDYMILSNPTQVPSITEVYKFHLPSKNLGGKHKHLEKKSSREDSNG